MTISFKIRNIRRETVAPHINWRAKGYLVSILAIIPPVFYPIAPPITVAELTFAIFLLFVSFDDNRLTYPKATA